LAVSYRALRWSSIGFLVAFCIVAALFLGDGLTTDHFQALYELPRPTTIAGWMRFTLTWLDVYLIAGVCGALIGFTASKVQRSYRRSPQQSTF
jgi:uncharacterized membrane protein YuzA (DUF378 family)